MKRSGIAITIRSYFTDDYGREIDNEPITFRQDFAGDEFNKAFAEHGELYKMIFDRLLKEVGEKIKNNDYIGGTKK